MNYPMGGHSVGSVLALLGLAEKIENQQSQVRSPAQLVDLAMATNRSSCRKIKAKLFFLLPAADIRVFFPFFHLL